VGRANDDDNDACFTVSIDVLTALARRANVNLVYLNSNVVKHSKVVSSSLFAIKE